MRSIPFLIGLAACTTPDIAANPDPSPTPPSTVADPATPPPTPIGPNETVTISDGACEPSGFCWEVPLGLGIRLHAPEAVSEDTVWMLGEQHGVVRWQDGAWMRARFDLPVHDVAAVDEQTAWALTEDAAHLVDFTSANPTVTSFPLPVDFDGAWPHIATDGLGTVWVSSGGSLITASGLSDGGTWSTVDTPAFGPVYVFDDTLWMGDYGRAWWVDRTDPAAVWHETFSSDDTIDELAAGPDGTVYLGSYTRGEIYRFDGTDFVTLEGSNGRGVDLAPVTGGVWATQDGQPFLSWTGLDGSTAQLDLPVRSDAVTSAGETVFGVGSPGQVFRVVEGALLDDPTPALGRISDFDGSSLDDLWAGTERGFLHRDGTDWALYETEELYGVAVGSDAVYGAAWSDMVRLEAGTVTTTPLPEPHWGAMSVGVHADGTVYVGTREGIVRYEDGVLVDDLDNGDVMFGVVGGEAGLFAYGSNTLVERTSVGWTSRALPSGWRPTDLAVTDQVWALASRDGGSVGLWSWDGDAWARVPDFDEGLMASPSRLAVHDDEIWISGTNGRQMAHFDGAVWTAFGQESDVRSLWMGADGAAYGTFYGGVATRP